MHKFRGSTQRSGRGGGAVWATLTNVITNY